MIGSKKSVICLFFPLVSVLDQYRDIYVVVNFLSQVIFIFLLFKHH